MLNYNIINNVEDLKIDPKKIDQLLKIISSENQAILKGIESLEFSIVIEKNIQHLNKQYRNKDKDTNILSFANHNLLTSKIFEKKIELGDLIFSYEKLFTEAKTQDKNENDHFFHLLTHGLLHLFGYDHEIESDAEIMENLEIKILEKLNIKNPYI